MVEPLEQLDNRLIGLFQREELTVTQRCNNPALGNLHRIFYNCFAVSRQMQVVWDLAWADSGSPILFIRFVGLNTNWLPEG